MIGESLSFDDIQNAAKRIQNFYRDKGYFLTQAFIPEQVKEGIIIIYISEEELDTEEPFEIKKNNLRLKKGIPESYFVKGMKESSPKKDSKEPFLILMMFPELKEKVTLKPGKDLYSTRDCNRS